MFRCLLLSVVMVANVSIAEEMTTNDSAMPDVPDMPLPVQDGEPMEADITIIRRGEKTVHEYRMNGKIYKIKIIPDIGPAYYFIDPDGDGEMEEVTESDLERGLKVNQWKIFSW